MNRFWRKFFRLPAGFLLLAGPLLAQRSAADWINPAQTYFKIPTARRGVYRLSAEALHRAGLPVAVDPRALQLFHRGEEVALHAAGEADGRFDDGDFVEFFGTANDGTLDSALYFPRHAQPHRFYNLYSDTTAYFLTWRPGNQPGLRMALPKETDASGLNPEPFVWLMSRQVYTGDYAVGTFYPLGMRSFNATFYTHADWGETYTGPARKPGELATFGFDLSFYNRPPGVLPELELQVVGRNPDVHRIGVSTGPVAGTERSLGTMQPPDFRHATFRAVLQPDDVAANNAVRVGLLSRDVPPDGAEGLPWAFAPTYMQVRYPAQPVKFDSTQEFSLAANPAGRSLLELANVSQTAVFYDLTDERRPVRVGFSMKNGTLRAVVAPTAEGRNLLVTDRFLTPPIQPVTFRMLPEKADFLLVTHEGLLPAARNFAAYRASTAGGGHDTLVVTMRELADWFNYGEWSPVAIRNFAETMRRRGAEFLFLVGQSRWPQTVRRAANRAALDPVPNAGWPSADAPLVMGLNGDNPFVPGLAVGRLSAATPRQVLDYVQKVRAHEAAPASALWRKRLLHLSGGRTAGELQVFRNYVDGLRQLADSSGLGVRVETLSKTTDAPVEPLNVARQLNDGVGLVTFFGHSGVASPDLDIGFCSNDALGYRNAGRFPLLVLNGCDAGNVFLDGGQPAFTTDWLAPPDRGAILVLAHAAAGYPAPLRAYTEQLYAVLFADSLFAGKAFGLVQREAIRRLVTTPGATVYEWSHAQQFLLQGDPTVVLFPATKPDYAAETLFLTASGGEKLTASSDSFRLGVIVSNGGRVPRWATTLSVQRTLANGAVADYGSFRLPPVAFQDTLFFTLKNRETGVGGLTRFDVVLDPDRQLDEITRDNNHASLTVSLPGFAALPLLPPDSGLVNSPEVELVAQATRVLREKGRVLTQIFLLEIDTTATFDSPFKRSQTVAATWLPTWKVLLLPTDGLRYFWRVRAADAPIGVENGWAGSSFFFVKNYPDGIANLPEGAIDPTVELAQTFQEVPEGAVFWQTVVFQNLTARPFRDSLLVRQTLINAATRRQLVRVWRVASPPPGGRVTLGGAVPTRGFAGENELSLTVNPRDQPEVAFHNNSAETKLTVLPDRANPVLQITFDGRQLEDGELVSPSPAIGLRLRDENPFLMRTDTVGIGWRWQKPGAAWVRIAFSDPAVSWQTTAGNEFRAEFRPQRLPDGVYALDAQGQDLSGNLAGALPYRIHFRVKSDSLPTLRIFPNPFAHFTRFSLTWGGILPPETAELRLFTSAGVLVRHLRMTRLRGGVNDWFWDGTDAQGALLPGGVYGYRLEAGEVVKTGRVVLIR